MDQPDRNARYNDQPGTPEAAHAALEQAMKPGQNAAYPIEVNLSRLTDELRARGITITTGRTKPLGAATADRPAHGGYPAERGEESHAGPVGAPGRPAAAERNRHGAEFSVQVVVSGGSFAVLVTADDPISAVIARALRLAGVPDQVRYLGWTLRTDDGTELDREAPIGSTAAVAATTLFLDPAVGGGGEDHVARIKRANGPEFAAIWDVIREWDVKRPKDSGYQGATGTHVEELLRALRPSVTALELETVGWLSAELAARSGAWDGEAPAWFPEPPEWIELWEKAHAEVREARQKNAPPPFRELPPAWPEGVDSVAIKHPTLAAVDRQLSGYREEHTEAHAILDRLGVPTGPEISPPTVLNRLRELAEGAATDIGDPFEVLAAVVRSDANKAEAAKREAEGLRTPDAIELTRLGTKVQTLRTVLAHIGALRAKGLGVFADDGKSVEYPLRRIGDGEGRPGTPPAPGTRHALILETIRRHPGALHPHERDLRGIDLADAIEMALLRNEVIDVIDVIEEAEEECEPEEPFSGLSNETGLRIARALETLTTSAGGALRELLDRTATDREAN